MSVRVGSMPETGMAHAHPTYRRRGDVVHTRSLSNRCRGHNGNVRQEPAHGRVDGLARQSTRKSVLPSGLYRSARAASQAGQ